MHIHPITPATDFQQPPSSNTGAQNTDGSQTSTTQPSRQALIDYLSVTIPDSAGSLLALEILDLQDVQPVPLPRGQNGYRCGVMLGQVRMYFGTPGMGFHFVMPGEACREREAKSGAEYWPNLYEPVRAAGGQFARVDLAIDDRTGALDLAELRHAPVRSRWKKRGQTGDEVIATGEDCGQTVHYGSRQSGVYLRMYDKAAQLGEDSPRIRVELELKGVQATNAMRLLSMGCELGKIVTGTLKAYLTFVVPNPDDSNKARWEVAPWWDAWLGDVKRLKLTDAPASPPTMAEVESWHERQVAPGFAAMAEFHRITGRSFDGYVSKLLANGKRRLREKHWLMIHAAVPLVA